MRGLRELLEIPHHNITVSEAFYWVVARRPIPKTKRLGEKECLFLSLRGLYPPNSYRGEAGSALKQKSHPVHPSILSPSYVDLMLSSVTFVVHGPFGGLIHSQPIRDVTLTLLPS